MYRFDVLPAGDSALHVQLPERIDPQVNAYCVALARIIQDRVGVSIRDVLIGYCSVTVYFDPLALDARWLEHQIRSFAESIDGVDEGEGGLVEVPVCYGGEYGPDIGDVARFGGISEAEVVALHTARAYRVYLVGFVPGFAYLAEVDPRIGAPRRPSPRMQVPAGSVAIAGGQTGIYPSATPGGWNIIGRTGVLPFDPSRDEPFLLKPGDSVRFTPIGADEFAPAR
jgi:inhibitor of KinA